MLSLDVSNHPEHIKIYPMTLFKQKTRRREYKEQDTAVSASLDTLMHLLRD
jgi:hypothetical protein